MDAQELAALVKRMRILQKQFFSESKTMSQFDRAKLVWDAKQIEKQVDEAVEAVLNPNTQGKLF